MCQLLLLLRCLASRTGGGMPHRAEHTGHKPLPCDTRDSIKLSSSPRGLDFSAFAPDYALPGSDPRARGGEMLN